MRPVCVTDQDSGAAVDVSKKRAALFRLPLRENAQHQPKRQPTWLFDPDAKDALVLNGRQEEQVPVVVDPYISRQGLASLTASTQRQCCWMINERA